MGDFARLLAVLDPDVALRADAPVAELGGLDRLVGADAVARALLGKTRVARAALLDGALGAVFAPAGQLRGALELVVTGDRISVVEIISDPAALLALDVVLS